MASSAHALIADWEEGIGLEFTSSTLAQLGMDANGRAYYTNHMLAAHPGVVEIPLWVHSGPRVEWIKELNCQVQNRMKSQDSAFFGEVCEAVRRS